MDTNHRADEEPLEPTFLEEILRRIEEIDSGKAEGVDAFQALEKM